MTISQSPKIDSLASEPLPVPDDTPASAPIRQDVDLGYDRTDQLNEIEEEDGERRGSMMKGKGKGKEKEHGKGLTEGDAGML
jgi:hypothetical protein